MKYPFIAVSILAALFAVGCDQGNDRLAEKARIEGGEAATAAMEAEQETLKKRSKEMEEDLATRQRFYQAVRGTYKGELQTEHGTFKVQIILVPTRPAYRSERVRTLEEIATDLTKLSFTAHVTQWNPAAGARATVGCPPIEDIQPDLITGEITIASNECPNLYTLILGSEDEKPAHLLDKAKLSSRLALELREGRLTSTLALSGRMYPTTIAATYEFHASKVE